jgi:nucleoid-associated protein YgaU
MAAGVFTILELRKTDGEEGERFDWVADKSISGVDTTAPTSKGGVRAAPQGSWKIGGTMRTVRTDYPGGLTPTEQVLGPAYEPAGFSGVFDDRYNYEGYAVEEMRRLEAVCRRGNRVRVSFQEQTFEGVITGWEFDYRRDWQIGYSLTISIHDRTDNVDRKIIPAKEMTPSEAYDEAEFKRAAIEQAQYEKPGNAIDRLSSEEMENLTADLDASVLACGATIDQREIATGGESITPFKRIGTHFRNIGSRAHDLTVATHDFRSDTTMSYRTALNVLSFESWYRTTTFTARILFANSKTAADIMDARDEPDARRLYRPREGESLYDISRRFYGTPWAWTLIYERNNLTSFELTGDETLIIPDKVQG